MVIYFVLIYLIHGSIAEEVQNAEQICVHLYPHEMEPFVIPDADMLPSVCPKLISYLECEERFFIETDSDVEPVLIGIKDVVTEICEEDSKLQKDYSASVSCFRQFEDNMPPCYAAAQRMYLDYRLFITQFGAEDELKSVEERSEEEYKDVPITYNEPYCLMSAYAVGCLGTKILDTCGQRTQETFVEIVQRSKVLTQTCPREEGDKLRSEFLDFLLFEKEHSHIGIFRDIFDFKKKK